MLQELALTPGEHPILLSEIASAPREQREKCLEVKILKSFLFEIKKVLTIIDRDQFCLISFY